MDGLRFAHLVRSLTGRGTRRALVRLIAALPLLGDLTALTAEDEATAAGRRMRRKKRHKHGKGRHRRRGNDGCRSASRARTCAGTCGIIRDRCKKRVDCGPCPGDDGTDAGLGPEEGKFLDLLNAYRAANGLATLTHNAQLAAAAEAHSLDMATRGYFNNVNPEGDGPQERIISQGYNPESSGENLAAGFQTAAAVFTDWKNSPGHNQIMLDQGFTEIGIGLAIQQDSAFERYWTTDFASPAQD